MSASWGLFGASACVCVEAPLPRFLPNLRSFNWPPPPEADVEKDFDAFKEER